jgi:hypothetical protein
MNQDRKDGPLALEEVAPETFREWQRRTGMTGTGKAWTDYALLLNHYAEAIRRSPLTPKACEQIEIVEHLNAEFAFLTDLLFLLFPAGVVTEKSYIQDPPASGEQ